MCLSVLALTCSLQRPTPVRSDPPLRPSPEVRDPELDSHIEEQLAKYFPRYDSKQGTDNKILCLARATCGVAAEGIGDDKMSAETEAKLNLLHNLHELGYP